MLRRSNVFSSFPLRPSVNLFCLPLGPPDVPPGRPRFRSDFSGNPTHHPSTCWAMKHTSPISRSGRFSARPAEEVARFTESISFDWRLWRHDILGSRAHAAMLRKIGVLTQKELQAIH